MTTAKIRFHGGQTLARLADTYPTIHDVLMEQIQNAIDEGGTKIHITINKQARVIAVRDNGTGVSQRKFEDGLSQVGMTMKSADKMGQFGIGLISPHGKCVKFTFTSRDPETGRYREWTFVSADLVKMQEINAIPSRIRDDLQYRGNAKRGMTVVEWRTEVVMYDYSTDRIISAITLDNIMSGTLDRFSVPMKRKHVRVVVHIIDEKGVRSMREFGAEDFRGVSLGDFTVREPDAGTVTFRMYLARATEGKPKKGTVLLGVPGDDYRLPFYHFASAASEGKWLNSEVVDALKSGIFEGEIIAEKVTLSASRKRFESDSATVGLCAAIEEWYEKKGKKHHGQALDDRRASRYQLLGERTLKVLRGLLDNPSFSHIKSFIGNLPRGTVGRGHFEGVRVLGIQPEKSLAIGEGDAEKGKSSGSRGGGGSAKPKKENEDHIPLTVTGDRGQERNVVREGSSGLQLVHSEMADSFSLASFDRTSGTITINVQHSLWVRCDEGGGDRAVIELQEYVVIQLLVLHATWASEADRKIREDAFEKLLEPYALKILAGEYLANRRQGRPSQKNTSMVKTPVEPARIR